MIFYHRTTEKSWVDIQAEGVLWGIPTYYKGCPHRHTYLAPACVDWGESYGPVLLEVEYEPVGIDGTGTDNYGVDPPEGEVCTQFSVFIPIPLGRVGRVDTLRSRCATGERRLACESWCRI